AEVDADVRLARSIGNGLGNRGDIVILLDGAEDVVDSFEYGAGSRFAAPPTGSSIHRWFDAQGNLLGRANGLPSPGVHAPIAPGEVNGGGESDAQTAGASGEEAAEGDVIAASTGERTEDRLAWILLFAVGGGALGGLIAQRASLRYQARRSRGSRIGEGGNESG
ncbi:MAG: hypothetical protein WD942_09145, partial [Dehalococcoidia bacterium]